MIFKVPVYYTSWGLVEVEAKDMEDLKAKLNNSDYVANLPIPTTSEYVDESYEVDFKSLDIHNTEK